MRFFFGFKRLKSKMVEYIIWFIWFAYGGISTGV